LRDRQPERPTKFELMVNHKTAKATTPGRPDLAVTQRWHPLLRLDGWPVRSPVCAGVLPFYQ